MEEHGLWPLRGGTRKDRLRALGFLLNLGLVAAAFYWLLWVLAPFF